MPVIDFDIFDDIISEIDLLIRIAEGALHFNRKARIAGLLDQRPYVIRKIDCHDLRIRIDRECISLIRLIVVYNGK